MEELNNPVIITVGNTSVMTGPAGFELFDRMARQEFSKQNPSQDMEWIPIDPQNLPEGEVLAANFKVGTYGYREKLLGYVGKDGLGILCDAYTTLRDVTHYIDIHKFDVKFNLLQDHD